MVQVRAKVIRKGKQLDALIKTFGSGNLQAEISMGDASDKALYNEFGTRTIPARPFIRPTFEDNRDRYLKSMKWSLGRLLGKAGGRTLEGELARLGNRIADDIKARLLATDSPPNAPSTVARKGFDDPLYETGDMLRSIKVRISKGSY